MFGKKHKNRWGMVDRSFISLFVTFFLIELTNRGSSIIDGLFVCNFFDVDLIASVGITKSIYHITGAVSGLFSVGMQIKCSHELGMGDIKSFNRTFSSMFYIAAAFSAVCSVLLAVGARPFAVLMGASGNGKALADGAASYLRGIAPGFIPLVLAPFVSSACQLDSAKNRVRRSSMVYFVSNCLFDYMAVKLDLGVFGIAMATSAAMYLQLGYLLLHFRSKDRMLKLTRFNISIREVKDIFSLGSERALRSLSNFITPVIINRIILIFGGTITMLAFSVQKDLINFVEIFAAAFASATALQTGVYYGEMNGETIHALGRSVHKYCALFLGTACLILVFLSRPIAMLYISERGELFNMIVFSAITVGLFAPLNCLIRSRIAYLNSIRKTRHMQIMTFLSTIVYTVISAFALGALVGSYGVLATDTLRVLLLMLTVWIYHVVKSKKLIPSSKNYLALPDSFDHAPGDVISLDIRDKNDVSLAAEQIQLFCRGARDRRQYRHESGSVL